jgi:drug/metabolite transporter (DMT)-like permease
MVATPLDAEVFMFYYFLVLLAVIGLAVNFSLNKIYQNHVGSGSRMIVLFNIITAACTAVIFFFINGFMNGFSLSVTPFSLWMAALLALLCGSYSVIGFRIISMGNIAVYTLFLMLGGMMLPYFYGLIFLDEGFSIPRLLGLLLMVVSIVLSGLDGEKQADRGRKKASKLFFALCIVVFCLNGMTSITSKIHQLDANAHIAVNPQTFVMLTAVIRVVFFSLVYLVIRLRDGKRPPQDRPAPVKIKLPILGIMVAAAAVDGLSYLLQLIGASHLPATVHTDSTVRRNI